MRHGWKLLGLATLATLGLMAVSATAAQATGEFRIGKPLKTFKEAGVPSKVFDGTIGKGDLLAEGLHISCGGGSVGGVANQGGTFKGLAQGVSCVVAGSEKFCKVYGHLVKDKDVTMFSEEGTVQGTGEGELLLMEGKHYLLIKAESESKALALFDVWGKLCPLSTPTEALHVELTGSTVIALSDALTDLVDHEFQTPSLEVLKALFPNDKLFLGKNEAHFGDGHAGGTVVTGSAHLLSGENWGAE